MGRAGRRRVETDFTTARMAADVTTVYREIEGRHRPKWEGRRHENAVGR
jgi:hypothetical protein